MDHQPDQDVALLAYSKPATVPAAVVNLYRDALQSIFKFLELKEFVAACLVNRSWYSSGCTMKSRKDTLRYKGPIVYLLQSPLRIHITRLTLLLDASIVDWSWSRTTMNLNHLDYLELRLAVHVAQLAPLATVINLPIPPHLPELTLVLTRDNWIDMTHRGRQFDCYIAKCLKQVASSANRLTKLTIELPNMFAHFDLPSEELHKLGATLTDLYLPYHFKQNDQIDLIKTMPSLRRITSVLRWSQDSLQRLADGLAQGPQLEDIGKLRNPVDEPTAKQLIRLPYLTKLDIPILKLSDPTTLLLHFPRLSVLYLGCEQVVNLDHLITAFSRTPTITDLRLGHPELTSDHLSRVLSHLTALTELKLDSCRGLLSLEFLVTARATLTHVRVFEIRRSSQLPVKEYEHLRVLSSSLESLMIFKSAAEVFDDDTVARWTPNSNEFNRREWPKLKNFELTQRGGPSSSTPAHRNQ